MRLISIEHLKAKGTDKQYTRFVQSLPSVISGNYSEWVNGEGKNPACHVRRASTSGIAYKPPYSAIPLTHEEHALQHQKGEWHCLLRFLPQAQLNEQFFKPDKPNELIAKEWFDEMINEVRLKWLDE